MINSISNNLISMPDQQGRSTSPLNEEQRQLIDNTLKQYDADSLSEADAQSIVQTFSEAGIQPGRELAEAMASAGFDAREVGQAAGVQGPPPGQGMGPPPGQGMGPPPGQGNSAGTNLDKETLEALFTLLDQYLNEDMSEAERKSVLDEIRGTIVPEDGLINETA